MNRPKIRLQLHLQLFTVPSLLLHLFVQLVIKLLLHILHNLFNDRDLDRYHFRLELRPHNHPLSPHLLRDLLYDLNSLLYLFVLDDFLLFLHYSIHIFNYFVLDDSLDGDINVPDFFHHSILLFVFGFELSELLNFELKLFYGF